MGRMMCVMAHESPLRHLHEQFARDQTQHAQKGVTSARPGAATGHKLSSHVEYLPYGSFESDGHPTCEIVATFGEVEAEYAAIRRGAGLMDCPNRGTLLVTGDAKERRDFLNRMLTQELKDLSPGIAKTAFWLNRKGRIEADLLVIDAGVSEGLFIDVDIHNVTAVMRTLGEFIVMEDVQIQDVSARYHHLAIHGKLAVDVLAAACGFSPELFSCQHAAVSGKINGIPIVIARQDQTGEPGFELIVPRDRAAECWNALVSIQNPKSGIRNVMIRPIGWHGYNIARIEAGTPLFNIDFGPTNLPHESGILRDRISFTKGCYLGQEIVARMENLGQPKHSLVGLRMKNDLLPMAGEQVFSRRDDGGMGDEVGVMTSSTLSPMLGAAPIGFAMLKTSAAVPGAVLLVNAEGEQAEAVVGTLRFWPKTEANS